MFYTNPPKDLLRREYDAAIIKNKFRDVCDEVVYFGMPGPFMLDVKEWSDYLGFVIAVENKTDLTGVMEMTANSLGLSGKTQILQGDIESVLRNWEDDRGETPARESFNVVNLDFEGGFLGHSDIVKQDIRTDAIRELFRHQKAGKQSFLLFLTVGFREKCEQEYNQKLIHIGEELAELNLDVHNTISWYLSRNKRFKLKVYITYLMDEIGRAYRYLLKTYLCFYYKGTGGVPMMHFIFDFQYSIQSIAPRRHGLKSLLNAPLYIASNDRVEPSPIQPPPVIGRIKNEHSIS